MLTGCVGISPHNLDKLLTDVLPRKVEAPLESLQLDHVELRPSQFRLALTCKQGILSYEYRDLRAIKR